MLAGLSDREYEDDSPSTGRDELGPQKISERLRALKDLGQC